MSWLKRLMCSDEGFTVVEFVIAAVILFIVSTGVMGALAYSGTASAATATRELGLEVANQRMEIARNLPYDSLGVKSVDASGAIISPETVTSGGKTFLVVTEVDYVLDYTNYSYGEEQSKNVRITVSWTTPREGSVVVDSNVIGKSGITNSGTVIINVRDVDYPFADVSGASITIRPVVGGALTKTTSATGVVRWGKIPAGSLSMTGTCSTHYLDFSNIVNPTVIADKSPPNAWQVDAIRASSGTVHVTDDHGADLPGVVVTISNSSLPAYSDWSCPTGTGSAVSDANGNATFAKLRKGTYAVTGVLAPYSVQASPPSLTILVGGTSSDVSQLRMNSPTTIKVRVVDGSGNPITSGATVSSSPSITWVQSTTDRSYWTTTGIPTVTPYTVTATKADWSGSPVVVTPNQYDNPTQVTRDIVMRSNTTIQVRVVDGSGNPITLVDGVSSSPSITWVQSTTDGSYWTTTNISTITPYIVTATKAGWSGPTVTITPNQYNSPQQATGQIALAALPTTIRVTVTDGKSPANPVAGAKVTGTDPSGGTVTFPLTGADGVSISPNLTVAGLYSVTVSKAKYTAVAATKSFTVSLGSSNPVAFTLTPNKGTLTITYGSLGTKTRSLYVYTTNGSGQPPILGDPYTYTKSVSSSTNPWTLQLDPGTYWVSRSTPFGGTVASPVVPHEVVVTSDAVTAVTVVLGE